MLADVFNKEGEVVSQTELADTIYKVQVKPSVLHEVVIMQLACRRSGTASTKNRASVSGSTRKLYRQKGTGRARRGDIKSPLLKGGGIAFGPLPRSYAYKVPKKVRVLALKMALSSKLKTENLTVIEQINLEQIKTRQVVKILSALKKKNTLIVIGEKDENLELSARNIPDVKVLRSEGLNVYDILKYQELILLEPAIKRIEERLLKNDTV